VYIDIRNSYDTVHTVGNLILLSTSTYSYRVFVWIDVTRVLVLARIVCGMLYDYVLRTSTGSPRLRTEVSTSISNGIKVGSR